ncbi:MAG: hypothetical protein IJW30_02670 [Clostridia bacterium]|nr:hypothetical protein [Clostridia bacterium]
MGKGKAIAGLVLSIVGLVISFFGILSFVGLPCAIVGLVLSVLGGKSLKAAEQPTGLATAGLVVGIIATALCSILFLTCGLCTLCAVGTTNAAYNALLF